MVKILNKGLSLTLKYCLADENSTTNIDYRSLKLNRMKTLIIYNDIESPIQFLVVEGDYSRFHGVLVNAVDGTGFEDEFCDWMFDKETGEKNHLDQWSGDKSILEGKDWDKVAICTWIP